MKRGGDGEIVLEGEVRFAGERIDVLAAHEIRMRGLVHCPERRRPFRELTVEENLLAGAYSVAQREGDAAQPRPRLRALSQACRAQGPGGGQAVGW